MRKSAMLDASPKVALFFVASLLTFGISATCLGTANTANGRAEAKGKGRFSPSARPSDEI